MTKDDADEEEAREVHASARLRKLAELAHQIEMISAEKLDVLAEMLSRADLEGHAQLLEEVGLRKRLRARMFLGGPSFWVLTGVAILVATFMRVGFLAARPFLGFGLLGVVLLLRGLGKWHDATEIGERMTLIEEKIVEEEADRATRLQRQLGKTRARNDERVEPLRKWQKPPKD